MLWKLTPGFYGILENVPRPICRKYRKRVYAQSFGNEITASSAWRIRMLELSVYWLVAVKSS
jgi:hypothetical protein